MSPGSFSTRWRQLAARLLRRTGALRIIGKLSLRYEIHSVPSQRLPRWRRAPRPKFLLLCYHRVGTEGVPLFSALPPKSFDAQMQFLRRNYEIVSLDRVCKELRQPTALSQAVAVTFDDGYRDLYTQAFPILQKYGIPATVFLTVGSIDAGEVAWYDKVFVAFLSAPGDSLELAPDLGGRVPLGTRGQRIAQAWKLVGELRTRSDAERRAVCLELERRVPLPATELVEKMLTWQQIREMQEAGIAFGSHTLTHPVLSRLEDAALEREVCASKRILEENLEAPVDHFAYPFGKYDDWGSRVRNVVEACAYQSAVSTILGTNTLGADLFALRRLSIGDVDSLDMFALRVSRAFLQAEEESAGQPAGSRVALDRSAFEVGPHGS